MDQEKLSKIMQEVMSGPIDRNTIDSQDTFDPSLTEFFDAYSRLIHEGKVKTRPAAERQKEDEPVIARILASGPFPISIKND